jgi:hypothetical protein
LRSLVRSWQAQQPPALALPTKPRERGCRHFGPPPRWRAGAAAVACRLPFARNQFLPPGSPGPEPGPPRPRLWAWQGRYPWCGVAVARAEGWSRRKRLPLPVPPRAPGRRVRLCGPGGRAARWLPPRLRRRGLRRLCGHQRATPRLPWTNPQPGPASESASTGHRSCLRRGLRAGTSS